MSRYNKRTHYKPDERTTFKEIHSKVMNEKSCKNKTEAWNRITEIYNANNPESGNRSKKQLQNLNSNMARGNTQITYLIDSK